VTYQNADVIALTKNLVNVKVDAEVDTLVAQKYKVNGYPTIILANADGSEIDRIWGYAPPEEFITIIDDYLAGRNTLAAYVKEADTAATIPLYYKIADKYVARKGYDDAEKYYRMILQNDPNNHQGYSDSALFAIGQMKTRAKLYESAIDAFGRLPKTYPNSELVDDAAFNVALAQRRAERFDIAIEQFKKFLTDYPNSELKPDADLYIAYCTDLKGDKDTALKLYNSFIATYPDSSDKSWVEEQIEKIKNPPEEESK